MWVIKDKDTNQFMVNASGRSAYLSSEFHKAEIFLVKEVGIQAVKAFRIYKKMNVGLFKLVVSDEVEIN